MCNIRMKQEKNQEWKISNFEVIMDKNILKLMTENRQKIQEPQGTQNR